MRHTPYMHALALALAVSAIGGCGGDDSAQSDGVTFAFRMRGQDASEEFRIRTDDAVFIEKARAQLRLPQDRRFLFPAGPIAAGNGGVNLAWGWHYSDADLAEMSIELCDGRPSMVQADLVYWLGTVKRFCPWGAYVHAEVA
ncbi:MAG: hypothetical protein HUU30_18490 [Burkholderiaceae bacterium]|nr:hypothetical protein [Aquabacterium sp.]NUP87722.1 hypothetical protein [Burkholderiaceae bacterium]